MLEEFHRCICACRSDADWVVNIAGQLESRPSFPSGTACLQALDLLLCLEEGLDETAGFWSRVVQKWRRWMWTWRRGSLGFGKICLGSSCLLCFLVFRHLESVSYDCFPKDWKREIESTGSEFGRTLDETVYPTMFGLIAWTDCGEFCGRLFDGKSDQWHNYTIDVAHDYVVTTGAAARGLICFVSERAEEPLFIIVMNPLTGRHVKLPPLLGMEDVRPTPQPQMVQLIVDSEEQGYKVFIAGYLTRGFTDPFAQLYDSETREWTVVGSEQQSWDRIHGCQYGWTIDDEYYSGDRLGPCAYDFEEGRLQDFGGRSIVQGPLVLSYAFWKNRLFVLQQQEPAGPANLVPANGSDLPPNYCISEYHLEMNASAWVKVQTHKCTPFDDYSLEGYGLLIHACNGFLMVLARTYEPPTKGWLYDLSTHEWRKLPDLRGEHYDNGPLDLMCELRWDAIP